MTNVLMEHMNAMGMQHAQILLEAMHVHAMQDTLEMALNVLVSILQMLCTMYCIVLYCTEQYCTIKKSYFFFSRC